MATFADTHNINKKYKECPYDPTHRIPANRMPYHLAKCSARAAADNMPVLSTCPYNATHRLPKCRFDEHVRSCPDNKASVIAGQHQTMYRPVQAVQTQPIPVNKTVVQCDEDWD